MPFEQVNAQGRERARRAPGREVLARRGAMLAYTGEVGSRRCAPSSGGMGGMAGRMMAGEQVPMMVAQGQGTVHYGFRGLYLTIIELGGDGPADGRGRPAGRPRRRLAATRGVPGPAGRHPRARSAGR